MIEICNLHKEKIQYPFDVKVDRSSILGNPFLMDPKDKYSRGYVCEAYRRYFYKLVDWEIPEPDMGPWKKYCIDKLNNSEFREKFMEELRRLYKIHKHYGRLRLFCWCAPAQCHSEIIKEFLEIMEKKAKRKPPN